MRISHKSLRNRNLNFMNSPETSQTISRIIHDGLKDAYTEDIVNSSQKHKVSKYGPLKHSTTSLRTDRSAHRSKSRRACNLRLSSR